MQKLFTAIVVAAITCASAASAQVCTTNTSDGNAVPEIEAYLANAGGDLAVIFHFRKGTSKGKRRLLADAEITYQFTPPGQSEKGAAQNGYWVGGNGREASEARRTISHRGLRVMKHWTSTVPQDKTFTPFNPKVKELSPSDCKVVYYWYDPENTSRLCEGIIHLINCTNQ